jgi:hypothetical protein
MLLSSQQLQEDSVSHPAYQMGSEALFLEVGRKGCLGVRLIIHLIKYRGGGYVELYSHFPSRFHVLIITQEQYYLLTS